MVHIIIDIFEKSSAYEGRIYIIWLLKIFLALIVSDILQTIDKINILTCKEITKKIKFYVLNNALEHKRQQNRNEEKSRLVRGSLDF